MEIDPATQVRSISFNIILVVFLTYNIRMISNMDTKTCIFIYLQGDAGIYECHANNKWSVDMRSFRTDYNIFFD